MQYYNVVFTDKLSQYGSVNVFLVDIVNYL